MTWPKVKLGDLIEPAKPLKAGNKEYPILSMTMHNGLVDQADKFKKRIASLDTSPYKVVRKNQLVVGFPIDEGVLSFQNLYPEAIVSPAYNIWDIKNLDLIDTIFFERLLRSPQSLTFYASKLRGSTARRRSLPNDIFLSQEIPLPPIAEQKRLAAILDRADDLRRVRRQSLRVLDELAQSLFLELFGDPLNPRELSEFVALSTVAEIIMGQSPPGTSYNDEGNGTPLLNGPTEFGLRFPTEKQWTTQATKLSQEGDIIFCVRGATAGRLNMADKVYCLGRGVASIRVKQNSSATKEFLYSVLQHYYPYFQAQGVGSTFINISGEELKKLKIPKVNLKTTQQFAEQIEELEAIKMRTRASLLELDALFASLQARAFAGELSDVKA